MNMGDLYLATHKLWEEAKQSGMNALNWMIRRWDPVSEPYWYPRNPARSLNRTLSASVFSSAKWEVGLQLSPAMVAWATFYLFAEINKREPGAGKGNLWSWVLASPQMSWGICRRSLHLIGLTFLTCKTGIMTIAEQGWRLQLAEESDRALYF